MLRRLCGGILVLALFAASAEQASAQETGTPIFKAPYRAFRNHELGASFSDPGQGVSFALEGFYRYGRGPYDFSLRGGIVDFQGGFGNAVILGGNFRTQFINYSESFPLDGALTVGFGGQFGDGDDIFRLPVGVSLGRRFTFEGSNTTFVPYAHPVIVPVFGGGSDDVQFALGLGVDINFKSNLALRVSGGLGDIEGVGLSVAYLR